MSDFKDYQQKIEKLGNAIAKADSLLVGAGSGLSSAAGLDFAGERLQKYFGDFVDKYGMTDMYSGCFTNFESREERWAYWSRWAWFNRFEDIPRDTIRKLKALLKGKDYFVLTTNIDHTFIRAGFDKQKLCYTQGDFGLLQCSRPCHNSTYDDRDLLRQMIAAQGYIPGPDGHFHVPADKPVQMEVPTALIPRCPRCGREMDFNLFWDNRFVRDKGWHIAHDRYESWVNAHKMGKILFLELGVGFNSPGVIKYPFWQMTASNPDSLFATIALKQACTWDRIEDRSIVIQADLDRAVSDLLRDKEQKS
ncbi:SIR2 family NAD-dependent protein deacylase [Clostridium vitabionis]|uniref:Sir2 silent information regulator family NAD-dependent deacetylase n=1 Tax=Clostridium vitabionis TaxID=2784388 RepID=UPI00188A0DED|nr:Sir2 silent information regulator family NAD-dependent deacetylase [Clostridium vitabionis]